MKSIVLIIGCLCVLLTGATDKAFGAQELNDEEMDMVTAGSLSAAGSDGQFSFRFGGEKGSRLSVEGNGSVAASTNPASSGPAGYLILRDNAQSGLRSFVNVNAVNSRIQVLINLIVNINSTVNSIHQSNAAPAF